MKLNTYLKLLLPTLLAALYGINEANAQGVNNQPSLTQNTTKEQVETKFILTDGQDAQIQQQLKLKASKAIQEQVYFYDTKNLQLYQHGLIIRVRMQEDKKKGDTTVKVLPMTYTQADVNQNTKGYKCEMDATADKNVSSCSLTIKKANAMLRQALQNASSVQILLTLSQQQMAQQAVPFNWNELVAWGPNKALVWKKKASELPFPFTVEQWTLNTGQTVTEISARSSQAQATQKARALKTYLLGHGLKLASKQESKTALALRE